MIHATLCFLLKNGKAFIERLLCVERHTNADKYRYLYVGEGIWEKRGYGELWNLYCPEKPFSGAYRKERKEGRPQNKSALTRLNLKQYFAASFSNICLLKLP